MNIDVLVRVGERVRRHRNHLRLSQAGYGKRFGFSQRTVSNIETGSGHVPDLETLTKLAKALDSPLIDLLEMLPRDELDLLDAYRKAGRERQAAIRTLIKSDDSEPEQTVDHPNWRSNKL